MRNVRKITLVALLFIAVGVIGGIISFSMKEETALAAEREVDITNIDKIDIQMDNGSVNMFPGDSNQAKIELAGRISEGNEPIFSVEAEAGTLIIQVEEKRRFIQLIPLIGSPVLNVYLPEKEYELLMAEMNNGAFQAEELSVREIQAKTDNGEVALNSIIAETINVSTSNGRIALDHVEGAVTGKSNNGAISLDTVNLDRPIDLETDNGSITVKTENEPTNAIIDARTDNGRITVFGNSDWDTMIGDGDNEIRLRTNNGRIKIEK